MAKYLDIGIKSIEEVNINPKKDPPDSKSFVITFNSSNSTSFVSVLKKLEKKPGVVGILYFLKDDSYGFQQESNDPYYTGEYQWGLDYIQVEKVSDFSTGSEKVRVGVLDI